MGDTATETRRLRERMEIADLTQQYRDNRVQAKNTLIPQAQQYLGSGNIARARVLFEAAKNVGVHDDTLEAAIEQALDFTVPHRRQAVAIEVAAQDEFELSRRRRAMANAQRTKIKGVVEMDGTYVGGRQRKGRKAAMVLVAVEVLTRTWTARDGQVRTREYGGRVRAEVVRAETGEWIADFIARNVEPGSMIRSDSLWGYGVAARELGYRYERRVQGNSRETGQVVAPAHRVISNLKAWLIGTHHGVGRPHLQADLDEFVFRFNRRRTPEAAFQTLLGLGSHHAPVRRRTIIGASDLPYYYEGDEKEDETA